MGKRIVIFRGLLWKNTMVLCNLKWEAIYSAWSCPNMAAKGKWCKFCSIQIYHLCITWMNALILIHLFCILGIQEMLYIYTYEYHQSTFQQSWSSGGVYWLYLGHVPGWLFIHIETSTLQLLKFGLGKEVVSSHILKWMELLIPARIKVNQC